MDTESEDSWKIILDMVTAARLLYGQRWKGIESLTMEEGIVKLSELAEMAELPC